MIICLLLVGNLTTMYAQYTLSGEVVASETYLGLEGAEVLNTTTGETVFTDEEGLFSFTNLTKGQYDLMVNVELYNLKEFSIDLLGDTTVIIDVASSVQEIEGLVVTTKRKRVFDQRRMEDVEGTVITAGKKTEVILVADKVGNKSNNNPRQLYSQVVGLNIYESTNCGLQLAIGGRGLDPSRTANFNTRQNGYDISADVLGYPESYYTPPAEALQEIQIIRGAASLQYGTQFGGLINFKMRDAAEKPFELITRQSMSSTCGYSTYNSVSGTVGKEQRWKYFGYVNYRQNKSDNLRSFNQDVLSNRGPRENSSLKAINTYANISYDFSEKTRLGLEVTYLSYLAQQPGGLTDAQFYEDVDFSNRERNWFQVDWTLLSLNLDHEFSKKTNASLKVFGLDASRKAVGFRTNRVSQEDIGTERDLIVGEFNNWGAEAKVLTRYNIGSKKAIGLLGVKYYQSKNSQLQGPGSAGSADDFDLADDEFPNYANQSDFTFPNLNFSAFGENIFYLSEKLSITPGFRAEYIKTQSEGAFREVILDLAGNPILNQEIRDDRVFERNLFLLGIGVGYKPFEKDGLDMYANISQNYRSVTFSDIQVVNPSFEIAEDITDEDGFTADMGIRGNYRNLISYDVNGFGLLYNNRIGEVLVADDVNFRVVRRRDNVGKAVMYGFESLIDFNILKALVPIKGEGEAADKKFEKRSNYKLSYYTNLSLTKSQYLESEVPGVEGNEVEFIPFVNLKTGLNFGYKNFKGGIQYTFLSEQFTEATNAPQDVTDNQSGVRGLIPSYQVWDFSCSYTWKRFQLETGVNNFTNETYFTRRATGYPGPGIIPSEPTSVYVTLEVKL